MAVSQPQTTLPIALPTERVKAGSILTRIHWRGTSEPFFGPSPESPPTHRFHDPDGVFRVCFLGERACASFAETFLRHPPVRLVTRAELERRALTTFRLRDDLRLVKLHGEGLAQVGCTADITSSAPPYLEPQALSRALWAHADQPDGIQYRCRHDNALLAIALYHRAAGALDVLTTETLVADRPRLLEWRTRYGFEIA
jgi:hypothetical protein